MSIMEVQYQSHILIEKFNNNENDLFLEKACNMLSDLLPITRMATNMTATTTTIPLKCEETELSVEIIKDEDTEDVLNYLKNFFFKDEPLNKYINLGDCKELEKYSTKCIIGNCSYKAVNAQNEIIGVLLNGISERPASNDEEQPKLADCCEHPKFKKIMGLMDHIDSQFNIFDMYPDVDKILEVKIVSVDSSYRGLGIAGKLTDKAMEFGKANDIKLINVLCSSQFSARVFEKMDFTEIYRLPYVDYLVNGEQVFAPEKPHESAKILAKRID